MSSRISNAFHIAASEERPAFVAYFTGGFPSLDQTVDVLLRLERGGVDIVELGIPFSDPTADGPTIQEAHLIALRQETTIDKCLDLVHQARALGLNIPVLFMSYYNPIMQFGEQALVSKCADAGVDGFILVDLPPEEAKQFRTLCSDSGLSYIPLITPSTSEERIQHIVTIADSFVYVVSRSGVTGAQTTVNTQLPDLLSRIQKYTTLPLVVGFGVSSREQFADVGAIADGVVIGSRFISVMQGAEPGQAAEAARMYAEDISGRTSGSARRKQPLTRPPLVNFHAVPERKLLLSSRFGEFGGQYIPEALYGRMMELERVYTECRNDPAFWAEFRSLHAFIGRPTPLHPAEHLTSLWGGAQVYLKREDLCYTGSYNPAGALGQLLVAKRLGTLRIIADTGTGHHGVATAAVCAKLGLRCTVYMGSRDMRRQRLSAWHMRVLGARVVEVVSGGGTVKDAVNEAMRDLVGSSGDAYYVAAEAVGGHPLPTMVRDFERVVGCETKQQMLAMTGRLPDAVVACVSRGGGALAMFRPFVEDAGVRLMGARVVPTSLVSHGRQPADAAAALVTPGVLHGARTLLLQDAQGQIVEPAMGYPGVAPELAWLHATGRVECCAVTDGQAMEGLRWLAQLEGIVPALESAHAVFLAGGLAKELGADKQIVICIAAAGDKDIDRIAPLEH